MFGYFIRLIFKYVFKVCRRLFFTNYDYCFLKDKIRRLKKDNSKQAIVVGISYSMFGIDDKLLKYNAFNLSMPSQDLYYSYKVAQKVIGDNKNIKYCIIGSSYYGFHFDLSSSKNEIHRVKNVYYPLLGDAHNYTINNTDIQRNTFRLRLNLLSILSNSYFNSFITKDSMALIKGKLEQLNKDELIALGERRALIHNKLLNYKHTLNENIEILYEFLKFLRLNNVKPLIVVFPATEYYRDYFEENFKKIFYEVINTMKSKYNFELVDLFDSNDFSLNDFIDFDHLNENGSRKMTSILNNYI